MGDYVCWQPMPNMFHINGIACLYFEGHNIYESRQGLSISISKDYNATYWYLYKLLGGLGLDTGMLSKFTGLEEFLKSVGLCALSVLTCSDDVKQVSEFDATVTCNTEDFVVGF